MHGDIVRFTLMINIGNVTLFFTYCLFLSFLKVLFIYIIDFFLRK